MNNKNHPFEKILSVSAENIDYSLLGFPKIEWSEFLLNPRRLRGSDFLMRWSQGVWSEHRLIDGINCSNVFYAIPYGPSGTAPHDDVRAFELYFERLEATGLGDIKRPDLLIFKKEDELEIKKIIEKYGGLAELPFIKEDNLNRLLSKAIVGIECENSLWKAEKMPDFNTKLRPQKRLEGKLGLAKNAVLPTIIIKEEDREPLKKWQKMNKLPIHVWHVFYDRAYGISINEAEQLIKEKIILPTVQIFQAPGGATTKKAIYKFYYHYGYPLGEATQEPKLLSAYVEDKNGHILPYVKFDGGTLKISGECLDVLHKL
ncbi:MAG: AccI family restriction endonuclease [Candidatus Berkelbacteria bacterium]|nr:AccI family restriction endonuclease [Candidatus Berkelbacteria bacterium]